jgi:hypothetical protein
MKNSRHALVALFAVLAASTASAQSMNKNSGYYGEVGYSVIKFDDGDTSTAPKLVRFVVGTSINANLDVEGTVALTGSKGDVKDTTENGKLSAKHIGFFAKPKMEIAKDTEVFGRIGISYTSWKSNNSVSESSDSFTKLAYGIGIQTQFTKDVYGQVDYMDLGKKDGVSAKGFTISVGIRF